MAKRHNRKNQQRRGPQLSDGERLWKRMSTAIGYNEELWNKSWNAQTIAELLITAEKMQERFAKEPKAERIFRAKLDQSLAAIRKDRQFFTSDARKTITMRKLAEIEGIKASIADWEAFFSGMARLANYSKDLLNLMNNPINRATKLLKMLG